MSSGITIKSWFGDDCRRFLLLPSNTSFNSLHSLIKEMYKLESDFVFKYKDSDGDLVTLTTDAEIAEMFRSLESSTQSIRLEVFLKHQQQQQPQQYQQQQHLHQHQSHLHPHQQQFSQPSYAQHPPGFEDISSKSPAFYRSRFSADFKDQEIIDVLRDISAYIAARDAEKIWAPTERNLISPSGMSKVAATQPVSEGKLVSKYPNLSAFSLSSGDNVLGWSTEHVGKWLSAAGFPEWEKVFIEHDVTGDVLVELSNDTLKDMGVISTGKRVKLLKLIEDLKTKELPKVQGNSTTKHRSLADGQSSTARKPGRS